MQQDPSSWNKPHIYRKASDTPSTSATATATPVAAASAVVVVAVGSTATPGTVSGPSALSSTIHSRSSASKPCLTSSNVRPNTNRNSDVLAIHPSFDLTKPSPPSEPSSPSPSPSSSPSTPLSSPTSHLEAINAIVGHSSDESPLLSSPSPASPDAYSSASDRDDWVQYNSKPTASLRDLPKDRAQGVENHATDRHNLGTGLGPRGEDSIDDDDDVDVDVDDNDTDMRSSMSVESSTTSEEVRNRRKRVSASVTWTRRVPLNFALDHGGAERVERDSSNLRRDGEKRASSNCEDGPIGDSSRGHRGKSSSPGIVNDQNHQRHLAMDHVPIRSSRQVLSSTEGLSTASSSDRLPSGSFHRLSHPIPSVSPDTLHNNRSTRQSVNKGDSNLITDTSTTTTLARTSDEHMSRQSESGRKGFFLPHFISSIRPSSQVAASPDQHRQEHQAPVRMEENKKSSSPERSRPHIVVTDVRSISFRDISTTPTLTTFDRKRSKRRNSSLSYSGSASAVSSNSDSVCASLNSLPSTSRRKRIKKSSSHSRTSLRNLCTPSCGCSRSASPGAATLDESMVASGRRKEHKEHKEHRAAKARSIRIIDTTEHVQTIPESEMSMSDRDEQHMGQVEQSRATIQDPPHPLHRQQQSPQQGLQDAQHGYWDGTKGTKEQQRSSIHRPSLRIQLCPDREQHHKRQRSPQTPSFQSSMSSSPSSSANSMERQKRARRLSSATLEKNAQSSNQAQQFVQSEATLQHPRPTMAPPSQATLQIQEQQPASIHPLDNQSSTAKTAHTNVEPSIHPLEREASKEALVGEGQSNANRSRKAPDHKSELSRNPTSSTARAPVQKSTKDQVLASVQEKAPPPPLPLPITRDTLRELDVFEIFKNPQVRHDIVFDPLLQFRPNFDGERGQRKRQEADRFWREVGNELGDRRRKLEARRKTTTDMLNQQGPSRLIHHQMEPLPKAVLLPRLINELREILLTLIYPPGTTVLNPDGTPQANPEQTLLMSTLDPDLLLQELDHGVLDVHALFRFLGDRLKGHCAPMRDALVESMVNVVVDFDEIVRGIRMCFEILEWMKLDIANHQLRAMRPWLLDNAIDFEKKYFTETLARGGSIAKTTDWFKRSWIQWESIKSGVIGQASSNSDAPAVLGAGSRRPSLALSTLSPSSDTEPSASESKTAASSSSMKPYHGKRRPSIVRADIGENILDGVVNEGLLEMILNPHRSATTMPESFELDHYRIMSFHNDFQDLTILCVLLILFRQMASNCWTQQDLIEIKKVVWLLLTDENANFGSKASAEGQAQGACNSGLKDIVIQIEFAARKVRERGSGKSTTTHPGSSATPMSRRSSLAPETLSSAAVTAAVAAGSHRRGSLASDVGHQGSVPVGSSTPVSSGSVLASAAAQGSLSGSETNLYTAWLDNALSKTSTLYKLIQKRLMVHFRRWLYVHSSSSMMVLSASCASLASAMAMSSNMGDVAKSDEDDEEESSGGSGTAKKAGQQDREGVQGNAASSGTAADTKEALTNTPATPPMSPEEANKAAAEALAAKLSFNVTEMEAHGLTGLEDEMTALLEKIRAVSEYNKKVYSTWYLDLIKQGRVENWLD